MATKKRPTKFRQGRRQGKVDAKKVFQGAAKAGLKDKDRFTKFSADDIEALNEVKKEAKKGYITDDRGNKISVKPTETSLERIARDRAAAKAEALRKFPYDADELKAMSKADRAAAETAQKRISEPKASSSGKPADRTASATQKVRSAVTVNEPKSQGYKVDKDGNKIKEPKVTNKSTPTKGGRVVQKSSNKTTKPEGKKLPVAKKGFAAGKELNAEGKAMYDKFIKEGIKPKSALNKALFRQEKGAKVAAKAAGPIATAAKSAASAVKKQGPVKGMPTKPFKEMTATEKSNFLKGAKPVGSGTFNTKTGKLQFKFDDKEIKSIAEKNRAAKATKVPSTVVSSKPNVPGKELAVRPKPGAVVAKTSAKKAGAKAAFKTAALGAAKSTGKLFTGKVGMALTAGALLGKPVLQALTKDPQAGKKQSTTTTPAVKSRSNQPRITGQGKFIGKGNVPTINSGGATTTYKVNAGDTLSGIAKKSGVTLSELLAENKKIKDPRKIYRNTSIKIPSKGKVPTGGYAGPVPYRPKKK
jgi:LysM repeat protein